jgi:hypothetical protein
MTKLEAFKEAARRSVDSPEEVERRFKNVILVGALPPDANDEIPPGEEEAFIIHHFQMVTAMKANPMLAHIAVLEGQEIIRERAKKN